MIKKIDLTQNDYHVQSGIDSKRDWSAVQEANYKDINCLVRLDLNADKMYVYSVSGMLLKRVNYEREKEKHGRPVTVSSNGQMVVFARSLLNLNYIAEYNSNPSEGK